MSLQTVGLLTDERLTRFTGDEDDANGISGFLTSYKATRLVMESMLEAIPQTILQLYIAIRTSLGCDDYPVSWTLLTSSLALSTFTFLTHLESMWSGSKAMGMSMRAYVAQLLE